MARIVLLLSAVLVAATSCAHFGQAALPPRTEFFVTTGDLATKDYQPVALVHSTRTLCRPCGLSLERAMQEIEDSLKADLIEKSKALGANGLINLSYGLPQSGWGLATVYAHGLAIKF